MDPVMCCPVQLLQIAAFQCIDHCMQVHAVPYDICAVIVLWKHFAGIFGMNFKVRDEYGKQPVLRTCQLPGLHGMPVIHAQT